MTDPPRRRNFLGLLVVLLAVGGLVVLHFLGLDHRLFPVLKENIDALRAWSDDHFLASLALFSLVYVAVTGLSLPIATPLSLAAGALFGRWWGTGLVSVASTSGAAVAFLLSRYLLADAVRRHFGPRLEALDRGVARDGAYYLLTLRLVPLVPFFVVNLGMGLTRIRLRTYWWVSQLGMLPATFVYVNAGTELGQLESLKGIVSPSVLLSLAALALVPLALRWLLAGGRAEEAP